MNQVSDNLARKIVEYCFLNDVLTQHGMKGLRREIQKALAGADALHGLALRRIEHLMEIEPQAATPEGAELDALASAVTAYEKCLHPAFDVPDGAERH